MAKQLTPPLCASVSSSVNWENNITYFVAMDMSLSKLRELVIGRPGMLRFMGSQRVRHD